jgi:hypothetical protein
MVVKDTSERVYGRIRASIQEQETFDEQPKQRICTQSNSWLKEEELVSRMIII